jgi:hypothetical protein
LKFDLAQRDFAQRLTDLFSIHLSPISSMARGLFLEEKSLAFLFPKAFEGRTPIMGVMVLTPLA